MAIFTTGNYNCACSREKCDWSCPDFVTMMSGKTPNPLEKYVLQKPQTNADKIRAMTDEELAEWIADSMDCSECEHRYAGEGKPCHNGICCPDYWLEWLKQTEDEAVAAWEAEHGAMEPDDSGLEIGFDPYSGCYTDDC